MQDGVFVGLANTRAERFHLQERFPGREPMLCRAYHPSCGALRKKARVLILSGVSPQFGMVSTANVRMLRFAAFVRVFCDIYATPCTRQSRSLSASAVNYPNSGPPRPQPRWTA